MSLGITIRKGAEGFTLTGHGKVTDLSPLTRPELAEAGRLIADAMGLKVQPTAPSGRRRRRFRNSPKKD